MRNFIQIFSIAVFVFLSSLLKAQTHSPLSYNYNGTPTHGVKIKTNIPFAHGLGMPTLHFEGYAYGKARTVDFVINWYPYNGNFFHAHGSSSGGYTPKVLLSNDNGKVSIFIDEKIYFFRFNIRAFSKGKRDDHPEYFQDWVAVDEPISGTSINEIEFESQFNKKAKVNADGSIISEINTTRYSALRPSKIEFRDSNTHMMIYKDTDLGDWTVLRSNLGKGIAIVGKPDDVAISVSRETSNVGIGTRDPKNKLSVNGTIWAKKVKVRLADAADWVFEPTYTLRPLAEVAAFIEKNKHLPEIPSAEEFRANDMEVSEMTNKLLQKIEELTLYTIEQEEKLEKQTKELEKMKLIEARLNKLEATLLTK